MATVFDLLDREWGRLATDRGAARGLDEVCRAAGRARSLGDVERFVRAADPPTADRVLLALVARAVAGDELAARVLLQLLLPGTRALANRWWALGEAEERAAAAVAAVYGRIRDYPLARRPGRVAANVLMDAARDLRRAVPRVTMTPAEDPGTWWPPEEASPNPAVELAGVLADAVDDGVITALDAELIATSRISGTRVADIAERRGIRPRTLWDRRQRAERALATAAAAVRPTDLRTGMAP